MDGLCQTCDMNTDLTRSTPHAHALRNFILGCNLIVCIDEPGVKVAYMYVSQNGFSYRIYNFIVTATLGQSVLECSIVNNLLLYDHVPLKIRLVLNVAHKLESNYCHRLAWHKAISGRIGQYKSDLECKLST